jgi:hypothetical protein
MPTMLFGLYDFDLNYFDQLSFLLHEDFVKQLKEISFVSVNLAPWGPEVGDKAILSNMQSSGQTIDLHTNFPFYGGLYNYSTVSALVPAHSQGQNRPTNGISYYRIFASRFCPENSKIQKSSYLFSAAFGGKGNSTASWGLGPGQEGGNPS